jgi:uncharacterized membrane protein
MTTLEEKPRQPLARSLGARLRSWFFAGLVLFGPLAVTLYIAWWIVDTVDNWVRPLVPASFWPDTYLPLHVPGFGVAIVLVGLTVLGFVAANVAGRWLVGLGEAMLDRTPVIRGVYKSIKQIFETVFSQSGTQFRRVGLVEFPIKGAWSIVFLSSEPPPQVAEALPGRPMTSVFLPCTPNPTTGFYFYVPTAEIIELTISPDEAAKLVMSAGLILPESGGQLAAMAQAARAAQAALPTSNETAA